MEEAKYCRK